MTKRPAKGFWPRNGLIWLFLSSTTYFCECKIIRGTLKTTENWIFLTRFCFLSEDGKFEYDVEYPEEYLTQSIFLYYDEKDQWPAVYGKNKTCAEKASVLSTDRGQVIFLNRSTYGSGCFQQVSEEGRSMRCEHRRTFSSARERWWYIAISNCYSNKGLYLKYRITMTNHESNPWFMHFSADELYILQTNIGFLVLYVILLIASIAEAHALRSRHLLHRTYLIYVSSVIYECVSIGFLCSFYALYSREGVESPSIKLIGKGFEAVSTILLLLLLILVAKGYTVTRGRLKRTTVLKIAGFLAIYLLLYAALFLYEQNFFDPARVLYLYESPAGYGIIGLRIIGWSWFVYATIFTLIHYPEKSNFYTRLFLLYTVWFLSAPVVILISTFIVPKWMREKLINGVELFISLKAHFIFFVLTRPGSANKNFPFHVRTTQIDIMRLEETNSGNSNDCNLDGFAHHPYALASAPPFPTATTNINNHHTAAANDYSTLFSNNNNNINSTLEAADRSLHTRHLGRRSEGDETM